MKTFVSIAVGLAVLCAVVSAQNQITVSIYPSTSNNCTGPLVPVQPGDHSRSNTYTIAIGECLPMEGKSPTSPAYFAMYMPCAVGVAKNSTIKYFSDSSCKTPDAGRPDAKYMTGICVLDPREGEYNSYVCSNTSKTTSGSVTSGSESSVNIGFLAFSLFLSSVVTALIL